MVVVWEQKMENIITRLFVTFPASLLSKRKYWLKYTFFIPNAKHKLDIYHLSFILSIEVANFFFISLSSKSVAISYQILNWPFRAKLRPQSWKKAKNYQDTYSQKNLTAMMISSTGEVRDALIISKVEDQEHRLWTRKRPLPDPDNYYDGQTYIVLNRQSSIFRFNRNKSLGIFSPESPIRNFCISLFIHPMFSRFMMLTGSGL